MKSSTRPLSVVALVLPGLVAWHMAASALGATYVVDVQHPQAIDTNAGTQEAPLKTIGAAARRAQAGDTVLVRPGAYRECVVLTNSGAPGRPIVFRSEVPHQAVICGSDVVTNWQSAGPGVWVTEVPNLVSNAYAFPHAERGGPWVYINGAPLQYADERARQMPGTFHLDFAAKKLYVAPEEGQAMAVLKVEYAHRAGLFRPEGSLDDIHVIGFTLLHNAEAFRHRPSLQLRGRRWLAENNHILWAGYAGLLMDHTSEVVVRGNVIEWAGCQGIGGSWNRRMLIESNVVQFCNWRRINPSFEGGGSKWAMSHDSLIRDNQFAYNHGGSIWFDWANCNNLFERNLCHDNSWGMFAECNWDETFRENIVFNSSAGLILGESVGCLAQRNILFNNDLGIQIRGDYSRALGAGQTPDGVTNWVAKARDVPDVDAREVDRVAAGYVKYHGATPSFMSDNNTLWENLIFDNESAFWEARDYGTPNPKDPYINNFSDYNLLHVPPQPRIVLA